METKTERNCRVQKSYDELMAEGKRGHYETMFRIVRLEVEREREACADACEGQTEGFAATSTWDEAALSCARAIRMRSNVKVTGAPPTDANKGEEN